MNSWRNYRPKNNTKPINRGLLGSSKSVKSSNSQAILDSSKPVKSKSSSQVILDTCPFEHDEQVKVVDYMALNYPDILTYAIPNGGGRSKREGARLKAEGVVPGMPDLHILAKRKGHTSLWVEMKRAKRSRTFQVQKNIHEKLRTFGDMVVIGMGYDDAVKKIEWYLNG